MALAGFSWVIVPTNFNTSTQLAVPAWIKGRAMGMYVLVLWGAFAVGSAVFGRISNTYGYRGALNIAGISVLVGTVAILWLRLVPKNKEDFTPIKRDLPEPVNFSELQTGPLRATVNYDVRVDDQAAFAAMLPELRRRRLQNGAWRWACTPMPAPGGQRFCEVTYFRSWPERVRFDSRHTKIDADLEANLQKLHADETAPTETFEPYTPVPGLEGEPVPWDQKLANWTDTTIGLFQREFVLLTERVQKLRQRDRLANLGKTEDDYELFLVRRGSPAHRELLRHTTGHPADAGGAGEKV
jgi:hypothetical protein